MTVAPLLAAAVRLRVSGVVQGVGFRPFVYRLAARHELAGWVWNEAGDVVIEVEGAEGALAAFTVALTVEAPPLARIARVASEPREPSGLEGFGIAPSADDPEQHPLVAPDVALCPACELELFDRSNRRYRYPFITCTDCGPRYSLVEAMPYDRERTSMRHFVQCATCRREYETPGDRRYHSETNSCPVCGPRLYFGTGARAQTTGEAALVGAAALLMEGGIVAVRGVGGYHLAVDATSSDAVERLRERKHRAAKPLAVMVNSLAAAHVVAQLTDAELALLTSPARPIVLVRRRPTGPLCAELAPGLDTVGLLLAYSPMHHLLLEMVGRPLVMTSGNLSEEPLAAGIVEAAARLEGIADGFLWHDREIVARCDDSVVRVAGSTPLVLRRGRGYAPLSHPLPVPTQRHLVAVGPHLKNTFTLAAGDRAFVSPHIGDLENLETLDHFRATLERYEQLLRIRPEIAVRDLHPGYLSSAEAERLPLERVIAVQHHHAHIAAVMAEHGTTGPVIGIAYDGTGYGADGSIWGAEVLRADLLDYQRLGQLRYAPMPGGDLAARTPWRAALGYLSLEPSLAVSFGLAFDGVPAEELALAARQIEAGVNAPAASSMGRLFDAAAAVLGIRRTSQFEGQAAMELESLAGSRVARELPVRILEEQGRWVLDPLGLLVELGERRLSGDDPADLAADFHASLARATALVALRACSTTGLATVALGGGVFQNARLLDSVRERLERRGLRVLLPRALSPNDGSISFGQAAIAAARLAAGMA